MPAFYMVSEDLNSGPYAGVAGTLPTEPFPQSSECYLGWLVTSWGNEGIRNSFLMSGLTLFQYKIHCFSPLPGRLSMYQSKWPYTVPTSVIMWWPVSQDVTPNRDKNDYRVMLQTWQSKTELTLTKTQNHLREKIAKHPAEHSQHPEVSMERLT